MTEVTLDRKIGIIGGCGHIGLPLGVVLAKEDFDVTLVDINSVAVDDVNSGICPFMEEGINELLRDVLSSGKLKATLDFKTISEQDIIFVTIGTPVDEHSSPVPRIFLDFFDTIKEFLHEGQVIVLRSTVFPGTSKWLVEKLAEIGVELAFCPERIVQGQAIKEIYSLPQITSATSERALSRVDKIFSKFSPSIVHASLAEAEFAKLFLNAFRYIQFAATNEFFMLADSAGVDYANIYRVMTEGYPRAASLPRAGLSAGPCLLKDTQQLIAFGQNQFQIGNAAILANEGLALRLIAIAERLVDLNMCTVGVLGMAFKADNDDIRSSLSYRVRKMLQLKASKVLSSDPYVKDDITLVTEEELLSKSDLIILCTPHKRYRDIDFKGKILIDIWNMHDDGLLFKKALK
ncbi:WecC UDP-N-acetyl-D-mannosaminuronate dehydrogenase [Candidatus Nanopelagicaceae bacterium]